MFTGGLEASLTVVSLLLLAPVLPVAAARVRATSWGGHSGALAAVLSPCTACSRRASGSSGGPCSLLQGALFLQNHSPPSSPRSRVRPPGSPMSELQVCTCAAWALTSMK